MPPAFCSFSWITLQMLLALIGLHSERVTAQFHPYISEFRYVPEYHPSKNPGCASQWLRGEFYEEFEDKVRRRSMFEEQTVDQDHPWIEIRAVLGHCTKKRKEVGKMFHRQLIHNCKRKIVISMKINNVGQTNTREEFVLVDHVLDAVGMHKIRLRNPFVIKVRQEPLLHLYGLRFQGIVNAGAKEEIINNHRANFTGCNDDLENPTCGKMLINGEPIPFSQGFCCSCEDVGIQRAGSSLHSSAKSNHYERDEGVNEAGNRSESSTSLFDNSKAQRQIEANEGLRKNDNARGRASSEDISTVNGPLGERALPFRKHREEKQLRNNSNRPYEAFLVTKNENSMQPILFLDSKPSKSKIEAFIDAMYEQAMRERAMKQEDDKRNETISSDESDHAEDLGEPHAKSAQSNWRINGDRRPIDGPVADSEDASDYNKSGSSTFASSQLFDHRNDDRYLIHESITDNPQNSMTKLTKIKYQWSLMNNAKAADNCELQAEKCDRSENFSARGNREGEKSEDRCCGVIRMENGFDDTPTLLAKVPSRMAEGSELPKRTREIGLPSVLSDNESLATAIEFFASRAPFRRTINENINYTATPAIELNGFSGDTLALLSNVAMPGTRSEDREFRISSNVNAAGNAWRNLAIRDNDNASGVKGDEAEDANVSMRISAVPAFARSRDFFPSPAAISRLEELYARPADRSSIIRVIPEWRTRSSLLANEMRRFPSDFGDFYETRKSRGIWPKRAPKDVTLRRVSRFWRPRRRLRRFKDAAKFHRDKHSAGSLKRFGKSPADRELTSKFASSDCEHEGFPNGPSNCEKHSQRRFRRHLRAFGKKAVHSTQGNGSDDANSRRKSETYVNYHAQPRVAHVKRKMLGNKAGGNPTKPMKQADEKLYRKLEESDNPFTFSGKESSLDKRIKDKFMRISNVLKEDSIEAKIIQEAPESSQAVARSNDDAKTDIPNFHDGSKDDSRRNDKLNERSIDELMREYSARLIDTHDQRSSAMNNSSDPLAMTSHESTMMSSDVITIPSVATWKSNHGEFHDSEERLSDTIIGPYLSSPMLRKKPPKKDNSTKSISTIYRRFPARMGLATSTISPGRSVEDHPDNPLGTLSSLGGVTSRQTASSSSGMSKDRDEDGAKNARFLELNSSRMIAVDDSAKSQGSSTLPALSLRGSITEPRASTRRNEEAEPSRMEEPLAENLRSLPENEESSKNEVAELVDRIVRQFALYTPVMPDLPTFEAITEPETVSPLRIETTVTQLTTTSTVLMTTTRITDPAFRPSIRPLATTTSPPEMHEEISMDETTLIDETEATTTTDRETARRGLSQVGKSAAKSALPAQKAHERTEKSAKAKQKIIAAHDVTWSTKLSHAKGETHSGDHRTELQQIMAANRSKLVRRKLKEGKRKQRYKSKVEYFRLPTSSDWSSSTIASSSITDEAAQTRSKRADFIREPGDRSSSVFRHYERADEGNRRGGRTVANKSEESPDTAQPNGLRSGIEKRLAGELDYPAIWESPRRSCESDERMQQHNVALEDVVDPGLCTANDDQRNVERKDARTSTKNFTSLKLRRARKDTAVKSNEDSLCAKNRHGVTSASIDSPESALRNDFSIRSIRCESVETDRRTDEVADKRKITANLSKDAGTASAEKSGTNEPLLDRVKGDQGEARETVNDKGRETRDLDETISSPFANEDARGTNSMSGQVHRVSMGKEYFRRPRVRDMIRRMIGRFRRGKSSSKEADESTVENEQEGVDRSPMDRRRSNRRLLSSGGSGYIRDAEDDYYEDDGSEADGESNSASDDKAIARSEDLSGLANQPDPHSGARDRRKLTRRLVVRENADAAATAMRQDKAVHDTAAIIPDDAQSAGEETILRNNEELYRNNEEEFMGKDTDSEGRYDTREDTDAVLESNNMASNNDNIFEVPVEEEKSVESAANNDISVQKKSFDDLDNGLRISQTYEELDKEPLSFPEETNENDFQVESLYETQLSTATFNTAREITNYSANQDPLSIGQIFRNDAPSQIPSTTLRNEGSIKISLSGRIQVNGGSNQTPMLISFDAIPEEIPATPASAMYSNVGVAFETTVINLPANNSNLESAFDLPSLTSRVNDGTNDSLNAIWDGGAGMNEANAVKYEKFLELERRNGDEMERRTDTSSSSSRIEKRLDKDNTRTAKEIFLTDYSKPLIARSRLNKMSTERTHSRRTDHSRKDKLNLHSNPVRFPDILGSVLVNNGRLTAQSTTKGTPCPDDIPSIEANNRSDATNKTILHIIPLIHIKIEKPNETKGYPKDWRNASGCYAMPTETTLRLPIETTVSPMSPMIVIHFVNETTPLPEDDYDTTTSRDWRTETTTESTTPTTKDDLLETTILNYTPIACTTTCATTTCTTPFTTTTCTTPFATTTCTTSFATITCTTPFATTTCATPYTTKAPFSRPAECKCDSMNAVRLRNMMAIVRFMMKLLRITDDEEPRSSDQVRETVVGIKNILNSSSTDDWNDIGIRQTGDAIDMMTVEWTKPTDFPISEWRMTVRIEQKGISALNETIFESFVQTVPYLTSTLAATNENVSEDEKLDARFRIAPQEEADATTLVSLLTTRSFLFYKPESSHLVSPRKNASFELASVKQNANVSFNASEFLLKNKHLISSNRSSSQSQNPDDSSIDRLCDYDDVASAMNSAEGYLTANDTELRWQELADVASNETIERVLGKSQDTLDGIDTVREDTCKCTKSKRAKKAKVSDERAKRTKLLSGSAKRATSGKRWAATRSVGKKRQRSRKVSGGAAALEKAVLPCSACNKINQASYLDAGDKDDKDDSLKNDAHAASGSAAKRSANDILSSDRTGELNSPERAASSSRETNAIRNSPIFSSFADESDEGIAKKHTSSINKKRDVKHRAVADRDSSKGNRVIKKRQKKVSRQTKWRTKKKKKMKGGRVKTIETANQRHSNRRLLTLFEPELEYNVDDWQKRYMDTEDFWEATKENAKRCDDESSMASTSEGDFNRMHIRGGQDCTDREHPPNVDLIKYLESAHCLRFSDLWYSVYQLEDPIVEHTVHLQVYEKRILANGSTYWADLTADSVVRLGTFNRHHRGSRGTIAFTYKEVKTSALEEEEEAPNLDVSRDRLLVPSSVTSKGSGYLAEGESDEYLVVPASSINVNGNECDKAGVGFAAFARQPDRCGRVRGTCLKNQPLAYCKHDMEARAAGRPGCYFLSNFASVPSEPIKYSANGSGSREFLALEYHSPHVSVIDIEVKAAYNGALTGGPTGCISKVHVDNTVFDHTVITVVMINTGLTLAFYRAEIVDCPDSVPESWMNATFPAKMISPRQNQAVRLDLYGELFVKEFYCSVRLLNRLGESVATRRIRIRKMDRCSCVLHCLCVCVGDKRGKICQPMSPELYRNTGCRGFVPITSAEIFSHTIVAMLLCIAFLILLLIFMGFLKWLIGLYISVVGRWGLDFLLGNSGITQYYERELKYRRVVVDEEGAPVHPDTRKRTVRICSRKVEFLLNVIFFLIFPLAICCYHFKKFFQPARRRCSAESKISLTSSSYTERPKTICVSTYGQDSQGSKMEAEDTKYVMDELRRSEESLRNHSRSKRNRSTKGRSRN